MDIFESKHLRHFDALARHLSFHQAADELHLTQPALTRSIQALERQLGGALFDRQPRKLVLTPLGNFTFERARALLSAHRQADREISFMQGLEAGELRVGFGPIAAETVLGPTITRFASEHPGVNVNISLVGSPQMAQALKTGQLDLIVGEPWPNKSEPDLVLARLRRRQGIFYSRHGHPLTRRKSIGLADLAEFPMVGFEVSERIAQLLPRDDRIGRRDKAGTLIPRICTSFLSAIKSIVATTDGFAIGTISMIKLELRIGLLAALPLVVPQMESGYAVVTLRDRTLSPAAKEFSRIVKEADAELSEAIPHEVRALRKAI